MTTKRVSFNEVVIIHYFEDTPEDRDSRRDYWIHVNARFKDKINQIQPLIDAILDGEHRKNILLRNEGSLCSKSTI